MANHNRAITIEIGHLLSTCQEERELILALATKFPDLTRAEFELALRDAIAGEIAASEQELANLKAELPVPEKAGALR